MESSAGVGSKRGSQETLYLSVRPHFCRTTGQTRGSLLLDDRQSPGGFTAPADSQPLADVKAATPDQPVCSSPCS